ASPQQPYPPQPYPSQTYRQEDPQAASAPMRLSPPGVAPPEAEVDDGDDVDQIYRAPQAPYRPAPRAPNYAQPYPGAPQSYPQSVPAQSYPAQSYPPAEPVPLGRERGPVTTGAVTVQPTATLACPIVSSLDNWFANGVQPAAMKWF